MKTTLLSNLWLVAAAHAAIIRRQDPGLQQYPKEGKAPNTFKVGNQREDGIPPTTTDIPPALYGERSSDLPFGRLFHGNMKFWPKDQITEQDGNDYADQSACGIPDNAYRHAKTAIHPYFLKYAGLDRYCMQDVCISFWREDGKSDMMLKVTDICSTDPSDPSYCETPEDIKVDAGKVGVMEQIGHVPTGTQYPEKTWWYFMKCWADGIAQPAYKPPINNDNWFTSPYYPNNLDWAQKTATQQWKNNQAAYPAKGLDTYPNGFYNTKFHDIYKPITDWVKGQEPSYTPIAGGNGYGPGAKSKFSVNSQTNYTGSDTVGPDSVRSDTCGNGGCLSSADSPTPSSSASLVQSSESPSPPSSGASGDVSSLPEAPSSAYSEQSSQSPSSPSSGASGDVSSLPEAPSSAYSEQSLQSPSSPSSGVSGDVSSLPETPSSGSTQSEKQLKHQESQPGTEAETRPETASAAQPETKQPQPVDSSPDSSPSSPFGSTPSTAPSLESTPQTPSQPQSPFSSSQQLHPGKWNNGFGTQPKSGEIDTIGPDICGNGGCKSQEEYCAHIKQNAKSDPVCDGQSTGNGRTISNGQSKGNGTLGETKGSDASGDLSSTTSSSSSIPSSSAASPAGSNIIGGQGSPLSSVGRFQPPTRQTGNKLESAGSGKKPGESSSSDATRQSECDDCDDECDVE